MTSVLVLYATHEGQTAKVAERISSTLGELGHDVDVRDLSEISAVAVDEYDAVLVGSPVNERKHLPEVVAFVEGNREAIAARPNAFFQLSLASLWGEREADRFVANLTERTGWRPDRVGLFAGAVAYTQYDLPTRLLFKLVSAVTTGDTDTSRDYEYTDWGAVETFAGEFAAFVEEESEARAAGTGENRTRVVGLALLAGVLGVAYWFAIRRLSRRGSW